MNKPSFRVLLQDLKQPQYVGRGATKLADGFEKLGETVQAQWYVDIGSSTGGFTDFLLQHGAQGVIAIDVGRHQLHEKLRADPRVVVMEQTHIRKLQRLPRVVSSAVVDLSFISVRSLFDHIWNLLERPRWCLVLFKPQFELPAKAVQRGGVVRDAEAVQQVIQAWSEDIQRKHLGVRVRHAPCGIPGKKKRNVEHWVLVKDIAVRETG